MRSGFSGWIRGENKWDGESGEQERVSCDRKQTKSPEGSIQSSIIRTSKQCPAMKPSVHSSQALFVQTRFCTNETLTKKTTAVIQRTGRKNLSKISQRVIIVANDPLVSFPNSTYSDSTWALKYLERGRVSKSKASWWIREAPDERKKKKTTQKMVCFYENALI